MRNGDGSRSRERGCKFDKYLYFIYARLAGAARFAGILPMLKDAKFWPIQIHEFKRWYARIDDSKPFLEVGVKAGIRAAGAFIYHYFVYLYKIARLLPRNFLHISALHIYIPRFSLKKVLLSEKEAVPGTSPGLEGEETFGATDLAAPAGAFSPILAKHAKKQAKNTRKKIKYIR